MAQYAKVVRVVKLTFVWLIRYFANPVAGYAAGSMWLAFCISLLMWWERAQVQK